MVTAVNGFKSIFKNSFTPRHKDATSGYQYTSLCAVALLRDLFCLLK